MIWNYHDKNNVNVSPALVTVLISGIPSQKILLTHYRIDQEHSNSFTVWKKIGSPQQPTTEQTSELERAGQLQLLESPRWVNVKNGEVAVSFDLPGQGVSLLKVTW